ncbi:YeiH family protein [Citricoccus sp. NR2]|uniref:YeiH family protein n=1 Tax=Citricoccus sp. NR2 TaxID=3004095 RepID=UPI0022DDB5AC|nr:putative sulfate exporter family transporter [Citricoccus sp. NR2]WBL19286.1 putative sulfate exporter family transporter [Citricoccus sp. NR2]
MTISARQIPGVLLCAAVAALAWGVSLLAPGVPPMLLAILVGVLWRNLAPVPQRFDPGTALSAKTLLRWGIVLLGLQLSLTAMLDLGLGVIAVVLAAVAVTAGATVLLGRWLRVDRELTLLVAAGFSICGAAAVAGAQGVLKASKEKVATAVGLVVLFGTLMIPLVPALTSWLGLDERASGIWVGASTHEVAQVVAAGGTVGATALGVAVTVKLARVVLLAPLLMGLAAAQRQSGAERPALVPWFVLGFIVLMLLRTTGWVPEPVIDVVAVVQSTLLMMAMFALGLGVHLRSLAAVGLRPVVLGTGATLVILAVGGAGALLV